MKPSMSVDLSVRGRCQAFASIMPVSCACHVTRVRMGLGCVPELLENRYSRKREDVLSKRTSWCRRRRLGGMVGRQTLERSLTARPAATPSGADISTLERLVNWMIANGIQGVDENGMVGLYEDVDGSRGVAALGNIGKGQQLVVLPLRLAIFDDPTDPETLNEAPYESAPWGVRLAWKILRMKEEGLQCPWSEYISSLPQSPVPGPLTTWSWECVDNLRAYKPMARQLDHALWMASSAWSSINMERAENIDSIANAKVSEDEFKWALSVVHSRTFGTAGRRGGVGARMLVPFFDMLNHGGDFSVSPIGDSNPEFVPMDNVRWDIVPKLGREPLMVLTATRDIQKGEELLLSYGERSNDEWVLHYGFLPPKNPHDDVIIFDSIEEGIDWYLEKYVPKGKLSPALLQRAILDAYRASDQEEDSSIVPGMEVSELLEAERASIKLLSGGRVDSRIAAAFASLHSVSRSTNENIHPNVEYHIAETVGQRSEEILLEMRRDFEVDLLGDLEVLVQASIQSRDNEEMYSLGELHGFQEILEYYRNEIRSVSGSAPVQLVGPFGTQNKVSKALEPPAPQMKLVADTSVFAASDADLLEKLRHVNPNISKAWSSNSKSSDLIDDSTCVKDQRTTSSMIPIAYRVYKCCILWDAVLLWRKPFSR